MCDDGHLNTIFVVHVVAYENIDNIRFFTLNLTSLAVSIYSIEPNIFNSSVYHTKYYMYKEVLVTCTLLGTFHTA